MMRPTPHQLMLLANRAYAEQSVCVADVELLLTEHGNYTVFAWRGTETGSIGQVLNMLKSGNWRDILRDLRAFPWYDSRIGWAHSGFLKGARAVIDSCITSIPSDRPIIHTGHSLGGALAQIGAVYMRSLGYDVQQCVAFGSPNVFLRYSIGRMAGVDLTLYKNGSDIVTTMPGIIFPYLPAKKHTQIGRTDILTHGPCWGCHTRAMYLAVTGDIT